MSRRQAMRKAYGEWEYNASARYRTYVYTAYHLHEERFSNSLNEDVANEDAGNEWDNVAAAQEERAC
jgi:hypothetical protein